MKIYPTKEIRLLDSETIRLRGITSDDLMQEAARGMTDLLLEALDRPARKGRGKPQQIWLLAGPGNNGGDALSMARMLLQAGHPCHCLLLSGGKTLSPDCRLNAERLQALAPEALVVNDTDRWQSELLEPLPDLIIDGLFGSGLSRPLSGCFAQAVAWINRQEAEVVSIDLPSGLMGEDNTDNTPDTIVRADQVLGLRYPRLAFLLPESAPYVAHWRLAPLGIPTEAEAQVDTPYALSEKNDIRALLRPRDTFAHKGAFGHGLLIAGCHEMCGGAILAGQGALRGGIGLLDLCVPPSVYPTVQSALPEAMVRRNEGNERCFSSLEGLPLDKYQAVAIGPALGKGPAQLQGLEALLRALQERQNAPAPALLLDADALNLLSDHPELWSLIPPQALLTPHPGELDRLTGNRAASGYERLQRARQMAVQHQVHIVLKGAYTAVIAPDGRVCFNATGNPGMATGGSGDVLSGILLSLLAQGYPPGEAARLGVWLHGLSGDLALRRPTCTTDDPELCRQSTESLTAGDLPRHLGLAFESLKNDIQ